MGEAEPGNSVGGIMLPGRDRARPGVCQAPLQRVFSRVRT